MSSYYEIEKIDKADWTALVSKSDNYNYRQSWDFGVMCAKRFNAQCEHVVIKDKNGLVVGVADIRIKALPVIGGGIAYINGGPLLFEDKNTYDLTVVATALIDEYVNNRSLILRIMPPPLPEALSKEFENSLLALGFNNKSEGKQTILIDLSQSLEDLRKQFHQKWRNCLNKGERGIVTFKSGTEASYFEEFKPLFENLVVEKKFSVDLDFDFYADVQRLASVEDKFIVTLAHVDGVAVAGHVASALGDTGVYLLGATNRLGRKVNAAYLLQWQAIVKSKTAGCLWYDLGGIDPEGNPGVYRFKKRMGGVEVVLPGPFEYEASGWRVPLTSAGEWLYKRMRR